MSSSTNTIIGTSYSWSFGDGNFDNVPFTGNTYTTNGVYTVCLTAANGSSLCSNTSCQTITITSVSGASCIPVSAFVYSVGSNGMVSFTNTSTNTNSSTTYSWNFGGGAYLSFIANPVATFTSNGTFNVCLNVSNGSGFCSSSICQTVNITSVVTATPTCSLTTNFSSSQGPNGLISFNNLSSNTNTSTTYLWSFGNGTTSSLPNPSYTYTSNGIYSVSLFANNTSIASCTSAITQTINVTSVGANCMANASFSLAPTSTPQNWTATPNFPSNVTSATWIWGDGTTSNTLYTSHQYLASATYSICLNVTTLCGTTSFSCANYFIYKSNSNNTMININVVPPTTTVTALATNTTEENTFEIYPNPNKGVFEIKLKNSINDAKIYVFNILGNLVFESVQDVYSNSQKNINISNVPNGIYFVKIKCDDFDLTKKIIINK
ncbi:MAG: PKD domain-containing protein [Bacteroidota bacterium]|nr:PKD domain-containing protein [Bacteroidota bacterium]